jgi:hypothetical protein
MIPKDHLCGDPLEAWLSFMFRRIRSGPGQFESLDASPTSSRENASNAPGTCNKSETKNDKNYEYEA